MPVERGGGRFELSALVHIRRVVERVDELVDELVERCGDLVRVEPVAQHRGLTVELRCEQQSCRGHVEPGWWCRLHATETTVVEAAR